MKPLFALFLCGALRLLGQQPFTGTWKADISKVQGIARKP
jgi:hypothetical protein